MFLSNYLGTSYMFRIGSSQFKKNKHICFSYEHSLPFKWLPDELLLFVELESPGDFNWILQQ